MNEMDFLRSKFDSGIEKIVLEYKGVDWWNEFYKIFGLHLVWKTGDTLKFHAPNKEIKYIYIYNDFRITQSSDGLNDWNEALLENGRLIFATLDEMKAGITIDIDEWLKLMG